MRRTRAQTSLISAHRDARRMSAESRRAAASAVWHAPASRQRPEHEPHRDLAGRHRRRAEDRVGAQRDAPPAAPSTSTSQRGCQTSLSTTQPPSRAVGLDHDLGVAIADDPHAARRAAAAAPRPALRQHRVVDQHRLGGSTSARRPRRSADRNRTAPRGAANITRGSALRVLVDVAVLGARDERERRPWPAACRSPRSARRSRSSAGPAGRRAASGRTASAPRTCAGRAGPNGPPRRSPRVVDAEPHGIVAERILEPVRQAGIRPVEAEPGELDAVAPRVAPPLGDSRFSSATVSLRVSGSSISTMSGGRPDAPFGPLFQARSAAVDAADQRQRRDRPDRSQPVARPRAPRQIAANDSAAISERPRRRPDAVESAAATSSADEQHATDDRADATASTRRPALASGADQQPMQHIARHDRAEPADQEHRIGRPPVEADARHDLVDRRGTPACTSRARRAASPRTRS